MSAGAFDPKAFLDVTLTAALDTKRTPVPAGDYIAICGKPDIRTAQKKSDNSDLVFLEVPLLIDSADARAATGMDTPSVRYSAMLEFSASGGLDTGKGKNVGLGRLREATGLNKAGEAFSMTMFEGKALKVKVAHRVEGPDTYADVKGIAPI